MGACPTLETERLIMRPYRESDLDDMFAVLSHPAVRASLHLPDTFDRSDAWKRMAMTTGQWELRGTGAWVLEERATGTYLGDAGWHRPAYDDWPGIEVGWTLHPNQWGKGLATEAGRRAIDYAFETLAVDALFSVILPENTRSQAVAQRLGFSLVEERVLSSFPSAPHGIWRLPRSAWT